ncbi:hypothetical protein DFH06DRAFT_1371956 [Mycena polygramma]|nr:hypothetical protein DFH06DRAFT_1371956 [Mycena polygramma]
MAPRKPTWDWKAKSCAELKNFTVPFAVGEYVQNAVDQIRKELESREWSDWKREDLTSAHAVTRTRRKQSLIEEYPGLLTGPHGALLKRIKAWTPCYVVSAMIPKTMLRTSWKTNLKIVLVVWKHETVGASALSVFNNHMDPQTTFSSFTVDGSSTSRDNEWAVGEKGKGFILATQFLFQHVESTLSRMRAAHPRMPDDVKGAVSFRVGHQIGTLKWKNDEDDLLQVVLDDLTPDKQHAAEQGLSRPSRPALHNTQNFQGADHCKTNSPASDEEEEEEVGTRPLDVTAYSTLSGGLKGVYMRRVTQQLDRKGEREGIHTLGRCLVSWDEVAITVIGIDGSFDPKLLFSALHGFTPPGTDNMDVDNAEEVMGGQLQATEDILLSQETSRHKDPSSEKPNCSTPPTSKPRNVPSPSNEASTNRLTSSLPDGTCTPKPSPPGSVAHSEDALLIEITSLFAAHKAQKLSLKKKDDEIHSLQDEINSLQAGRNDAERLVEVLKNDCATHERRMVEKDNIITALQSEIEQLREKDAEIEEILRSRKRVRI